MAQDELQRDLATLQSYLDGFYATHLINTGLELGLFTRLSHSPQGITVQELAKQLGLHAPYVSIWCQTALCFGLLECDEAGRYRLASKYDVLLGDPSHPKFFGLMQVAVRIFGKELQKHVSFTRTGAVDAARSAELVEFSARGAERARAPLFVDKVIPMIPELQTRLISGAYVLDVGCGAGVFIEKMATAFPKSYFVGIDDSVNSIEVANKRIEDNGLTDRARVELMKGEVLAFQDSFDAVILIMVLHEIHPSVRAQALNNCCRALKEDGMLVIWDFAFPNSMEDFKNPLFRSGVTDQFFEMTRGTVHPIWSELREQLESCGFTKIDRRLPDISPGFYLLTAQKS